MLEVVGRTVMPGPQLTTYLLRKEFAVLDDRTLQNRTIIRQLPHCYASSARDLRFDYFKFLLAQHLLRRQYSWREHL